MFKPLLRTLPTLSGNFTIGCKINEIIKDSVNEYHTHIRNANIMPLQNNIYNTYIDLNLLNGKYEFDVPKYHYIYSDIFYEENFSYNKLNYAELDLNNPWNSHNDSRNKDYEFGCKRINHSQLNYQFCFYAPFYLDDINDLPNYFCIHIRFNDHLEKTIKVYINDDFKANYLLAYLKKYFKQIDDRVIFCLPNSLQATYFGIDIKNGGLVQYKDNEIGTLYINQTTINNFDYTICKGFERNNLIMTQIFPISFMFNINDILSNYEKECLYGTQVNISGYYYSKNNIKHDFYDFDINYVNSYNKYNKYDELTGTYKYSFGVNNDNPINVMNIGYPALNEAKYIKYAYTNKVTPKYCKFKMLLSPDSDPYITNLNFAYSYLQFPNQKYGYFPTMFKGIYPQAYIKNKDFKLPIGNDKLKYYETIRYYANNVFTDTTNIDKYIKLMSNYCSYWYDMSPIDINDNMFKDHSLWSNIKYNYAYHKGILYNFNELQEYNIDKFGVFLNVNINYVNEDKLNSDFTRAKYVLSKSEKSSYTIGNYNNAYNMSNYVDAYGNTCYNKIFDLAYNYKNDSYILFNKVMKLDDHGTYIEEKNYVKENTFYKYDDVLNEFKNKIRNDYLYEKLAESKIKGYRLLDGVNTINYFETYEDDNGNEKKRFMLTEDLYKANNVSDRFYWLYDSLYYTDSRSTSKKQIKSIYDTIDYNEDLYGKIAIFIEEDYIHLSDIYNILNELDLEDPDNSNKYINYGINLEHNLQPYIYERYNEENGLILKDYFIKIDKPYTEIYVDPYNLNNLISLYNKQYNITKTNKLSLINSGDKTEDMFIKLINKDHIIEYYLKLNNDENYKSTLGIKSLLDTIYVKQRYWVIDKNNIEIKDVYVTLNEFLLKYSLRYSEKFVKDTNAYTDEYIELLSIADAYKKICDIYNNDKKLKWICENLSNSRVSNNKFTFNLFGYKLELDLCFKKKMILLNDELTKFILNDKELSNFIYLYIKSSCKNENYDIWPILKTNDLSTKQYKNNEDIDNYLIPLFNSPYLNDNDINTELAMISNNKISNNKYIYNTGKYFKEIDVFETVLQNTTIDDILYLNTFIDDNVWYAYTLTKLREDSDFENFGKNIYNESNINKYISYKLEFIYKTYNELFYEFVKMKNIGPLYSLYDILNVAYDKLDISNLSNIIYNDYYKIYICKYNGLTYGFYYLTINVDNTNNSFNILNDYNLNVCFESINGKLINESNKEYFNNKFYILQPLLKTNIFDDFSKNINTIIYPYEAEILIKYVQSKATNKEADKYLMLKDYYEDPLYDKIIPLVDQRKIKLLRYFNYISPYLKKTNIIEDAWKLKFMDNNNFTDIEKTNIFYKEDINIYQYDKLHVYDKIFDKTDNEFTNLNIVSQYEYKHFNDNSLFNLEENIIYEDPKLYGNDYIETLKTEDNILNKKLQILLKYFKRKGLDYTNIILFLYNKYESSIEIEKIKVNSNNTDNKYKISYKFKLK